MFPTRRYKWGFVCRSVLARWVARDHCGRDLQGSQLAVTVPVARGGVAALLRKAEPVRDSLLQAAQESVSDKVMMVVKQSARLL